MQTSQPTPSPPAPTFIDLWSLLYNNGATNYNKFDCCSLWDSLTADQQAELYNVIKLRLDQKRYVSYNGYQAMQEGLREVERLQRQFVTPPTNYNHSGDFDRMVATGTLVTAEYQGQVGIYTEADATKHHMRIIKHLQA